MIRSPSRNYVHEEWIGATSAVTLMLYEEQNTERV